MKKTNKTITSISDVQGSGLWSELAGKIVTVRGVVTGVGRRGFFIQSVQHDYNHRGKLQVLMHGIVPKELAEQRAEYEIIHGNELLGGQPGELGNKPSDHAYVIAKIRMDL